jgi:hypothetical protein
MIAAVNVAEGRSVSLRERNEAHWTCVAAAGELGIRRVETHRGEKETDKKPVQKAKPEDASKFLESSVATHFNFSLYAEKTGFGPEAAIAPKPTVTCPGGCP